MLPSRVLRLHRYLAASTARQNTISCSDSLLTPSTLDRYRTSLPTLDLLWPVLSTWRLWFFTLTTLLSKPRNCAVLSMLALQSILLMAKGNRKHASHLIRRA